jgi:prepilin-type N-terminal cleavage/methylation domain-containing protein
LREGHEVFLFARPRFLAFTLIELLVVIAIIAILASLFKHGAGTASFPRFVSTAFCGNEPSPPLLVHFLERVL